MEIVAKLRITSPGNRGCMQRLTAIFIVICMVLIAGAIGAALYLGTGLSLVESAVAAVAALCALAIANMGAALRRNREELSARIAGLSRGVADLARQVGDLGRRTVELEARSDAVVDRIQNATLPLAKEVAELGALVRQLADTVTAHETALAKPALDTIQSSPQPPPEPKVAAEPLDLWPFMPAAREERRAADRLAAEIRDAIEASRIDLYLQPIVTLPQRKVRYYQTSASLRTEDGRTLEPEQYLPIAERTGLVARLDQTMLSRCVHVLRRMQQTNREVGLFCNFSTPTLNDAQVFSQISQYLEANRVLAPNLSLDFTQAAWRAMGPLELEALTALRTLGFRFGMNRVTDLRIEPRDLADRGIRFVKVPAALLLGRISSTVSTDIHIADLSGLLGRYSINLVADSIETETDVVDLLDHELKFGQGNLFSPPRPVRTPSVSEASGSPAVEAGSDKASELAARPPTAAAR